MTNIVNMADGRRVSDNLRFLGRNPGDPVQHQRDSYRAFFERNPAGIYLVSMPNGILENCNAAFAHLLGYESPLDLLGQQLSRFFVDPGSYESSLRSLMTQDQVSGDQQCVRRQDGSEIWVLQDISRMDEEGSKEIKILGTVVDITSQKQKEEHFLQSSLYDALTGLPNRTLFLDRLGVCYERARRNQEYQFAVLFLDLDRFKWINDSFGHRVGDELLVAAAKRLNSKIRGGDTVARLGGDEFAVLLGEVVDTEEATRVATRIQSAFQNPFRLGERELFITVSIGIAMSSGQWFCNQEGKSAVSPVSQTAVTSPLDRPEDLLWEADAVLYRAKQLGRARYEVFDAAMHQKVMTLAQLEQDLRKAVQEDEFTCYYLPAVSLQTGRIIGFEACLRWQHPTRGLLNPAEFALLAEQMGLHGAIDRAFVKKACLHLKQLHEAFPSHEQIFISANLSISAFRDPEFVQFVADLIQPLKIGRERLWFEVSESTLIEHFEGIRHTLNELRSLGVSITLDDFGTGFSSLKGLPQFPVDVLKIDSSLIAGMKVDDMYVDVVGTLIALGHSLGFSIFAEGVETEQQIVELKRLGCEGSQGTFVSEAVDANTTCQLLVENGTYIRGDI
jgi:diguanylate cyclase (GGDEF)-like protein/PAS domain S-box-containing protein